MTHLTVRHVTVYRYAQPVAFDEHRLMFRPQDSHDLRLLDARLAISPPPALMRWYHDVFNNSIAIASFDQPASELRFESNIDLQLYAWTDEEFSIADFATTLPFTYPPEELPDLGRTIERHYRDPEGRVDAWVQQFLPADSDGRRTSDFLESLTRGIAAQFQYEMREEPGVQTPVETLERGSGSCRDFALLMMEAARSQGLAARFVTGYLYDPAIDPARALRGTGSTHAWAQVYLPGAGWVSFDPTNGIVGGANLIRVGVARDPSQAVPLSGSYKGAPEDFLGMTVEVTVSAS